MYGLLLKGVLVFVGGGARIDLRGSKQIIERQVQFVSSALI